MSQRFNRSWIDHKDIVICSMILAVYHYFITLLGKSWTVNLKLAEIKSASLQLFAPILHYVSLHPRCCRDAIRPDSLSRAEWGSSKPVKTALSHSAHLDMAKPMRGGLLQHLTLFLAGCSQSQGLQHTWCIAGYQKAQAGVDPCAGAVDPGH